MIVGRVHCNIRFSFTVFLTGNTNAGEREGKGEGEGAELDDVRTNDAKLPSQNNCAAKFGAPGTLDSVLGPRYTMFWTSDSR